MGQEYRQQEKCINSSGTTGLFTGAYNKRVEQNKNKAASAAGKAERKDTGAMTARETLGMSVEISEESKAFMAGVAECKAVQIAEREAERRRQSWNWFLL